MAWSKRARKGLLLCVLVTIGFTLASIFWLWTGVRDDPNVTMLAFAKIAAVVAGVWIAIGATMTIFIVMVLRRNEGDDTR